jgi:hypothetical protein
MGLFQSDRRSPLANVYAFANEGAAAFSGDHNAESGGWEARIARR